MLHLEAEWPGVNAPECPPVSAVLGRTVARKSSTGGLHVCVGGLDILKICFYSQHEQHLQIVQIRPNYNIFAQLPILGS